MTRRHDPAWVWMIGAFGMIVLELVGARRHLWGVAWGVAALLGVVLLTRSHARHR